MAKGRFISFEGGEGAGKSTQTKLLAERLRARGLNIVLTREPGGSPGAEEIRKLLVEGAPERWTPMTETLLFLAARADHVERVIRPALERGDWVICDRFFDSTIVYQGVARGLGVDVVKDLQHAALGDFAPDLTFILDLDPAQGLERAGKRATSGENRFEQFDADFHQRLRKAFKEIAAKEGARCVLVSAARDIAAIEGDIWSAVDARFLA